MDPEHFVGPGNPSNPGWRQDAHHQESFVHPGRFPSDLRDGLDRNVRIDENRPVKSIDEPSQQDVKASDWVSKSQYRKMKARQKKLVAQNQNQITGEGDPSKIDGSTEKQQAHPGRTLQAHPGRTQQAHPGKSQQNPEKRPYACEKMDPRTWAKEQCDLAVVIKRKDGISLDNAAAQEVRNRLAGFIEKAALKGTGRRLAFATSGLVSSGNFLVTPLTVEARDWVVSCDFGEFNGVPFIVRTLKPVKVTVTIRLPGKKEDLASDPLWLIRRQNDYKKELRLQEWTLLNCDTQDSSQRTVLTLSVPLDVNPDNLWLNYQATQVHVRFPKGYKPSVGSSDPNSGIELPTQSQSTQTTPYCTCHSCPIHDSMPDLGGSGDAIVGSEELIGYTDDNSRDKARQEFLGHTRDIREKFGYGGDTQRATVREKSLGYADDTRRDKARTEFVGYRGDTHKDADRQEFVGDTSARVQRKFVGYSESPRETVRPEFVRYPGGTERDMNRQEFDYQRATVHEEFGGYSGDNRRDSARSKFVDMPRQEIVGYSDENRRTPIGYNDSHRDIARQEFVDPGDHQRSIREEFIGYPDTRRSIDSERQWSDRYSSRSDERIPSDPPSWPQASMDGYQRRIKPDIVPEDFYNKERRNINPEQEQDRTNSHRPCRKRTRRGLRDLIKDDGIRSDYREERNDYRNNSREELRRKL